MGVSKIIHAADDRTTKIFSDWLLPPPKDPATRCAATLVAEFDLSPPVDVDVLVGQFCDVEFVPWPYTCDAIVVGLGGSRPKVFVRKNNVGRRRRRFTVGHELGHVVLPWHIGIPTCAPFSADFDAEPLGPASAGDLFSTSRIAEQEGEANRFASALLIPRRFIESCSHRELGDVVEELNKADVSAAAAMLALARNLLPGFLFLIDEDEDGFRWVESSGTKVSARSGRAPTEAQLRGEAHDSGEAVVSGRRVLWFQLASPANFTLPEDERSTTQILRDSLAKEGTGVPALSARINGIVGGMLAKDERAQNESQALSVLEHRFASDPELRHLLENSDFQLYLRRKAASRVKP